MRNITRINPNPIVVEIIVLKCFVVALNAWDRKCYDNNNCNCDLEPESGFCKAVIPKYYFDKNEGKCKVFTWGGCGGVVPFDSLEECEECGCND